MSQNNTNRDIRRFETDADGNTTKVLLNTDEPLGLLDGDYQEQLEELENRLNAITGGAYSNTVQITHGGTGADNANDAMTNLVSILDSLVSSDQFGYSFIAQRTSGSGSGGVYRISQSAVAEQIGALKASNNLSDLLNTLTGLQNLYHDVPIAESQGGVPLKAWFDSLYVMLGRIVGTGVDNYYIEPNRYTLKDLVDNYLSEYFTKKSNDLSDLNSISDAVSNLIDGLSSAGIPVINQNVELMAKQPRFPSGTGKITLEDIFDNYLLSAFNTEYGMTKDLSTEKYVFDGIAEKADVADATLAMATSDLASRVHFGDRLFNTAVVSVTATGQTTVTKTFTSTTETPIFNILSVTPVHIIGLSNSVKVNGYTVTLETPASSGDDAIYTVTVDVEALGTNVNFDLEFLYCYKYVG